MKKIILTIAIIFVIILWIFSKNIFSIYFYIQWDIDFKNKNFTEAQENYSKSIKYWYNYNVEFNRANSLYFIWKNSNNKEIKIKNYQKSLEIYKKLLKEKNIAEVKTNHDFVEKELEKLFAEEQKKQEEQENQDSEKNNSEKQNSEKENSEKNKDENLNSENKSENKTEEEGKNNEITEWENWNSETGNDNKNQNTENKTEESEWTQVEEYELTERDLKNIQEYTKELQEEQRKNQKYFNKSWNNWISTEDKMKNNFFNDTFFSDVFDRWWEKDW